MDNVSFFNDILRSAFGMGWLQWAAFICSVTYVILAAKENIWCWAFGLVGVILAFLVYVDPDVRLYSEAVLQIFYAVMSVYGWMAWQNNKENKEMILDESLEQHRKHGLKIAVWPIKTHLIIIVAGTVAAILWGTVWSHFGAALPYIDAFTSAFAVIATYMVTRKILENWIYWIVIDFVGIFVSIHRGLYLFAFLFFIYCVIAIFGFINWRKRLFKKEPQHYIK